MGRIPLFGRVFLIKRNPFLSKTYEDVVADGTVEVKKEWVLARPPPWFGKPERLSEAQLEQILRFAEVAMRTKGMKASPRLRVIKQTLKRMGPTGKAKARVPRFTMPAILQIAEGKGIKVPDELKELVSKRLEELKLPAPTPAPAPTAPPTPKPAVLKP
jgi:hypothetical protein